MSKVENAADGSWANLNSNQAVNLKNTSPFKALKFSASPIIFWLFLVNRHLGKKVSTAWTNFVLKKGSGGPGFKPRPSRCFLRQGTLLHFVSLYPGV